MWLTAACRCTVIIPFILAGEDIVAVDAFTTALMGINPDSIQTIVLGHAAGLGEQRPVAH